MYEVISSYLSHSGPHGNSLIVSQNGHRQLLDGTSPVARAEQGIYTAASLDRSHGGKKPEKKTWKRCLPCMIHSHSTLFVFKVQYCSVMNTVMKAPTLEHGEQATHNTSANFLYSLVQTINHSISTALFSSSVQFHWVTLAYSAYSVHYLERFVEE